MKIGILTYSRSNNCGALLQNYALEHYLSKYYQVSTINYLCERIERNNRIFVIKSIRDFIKMIICLPSFTLREIKFNNFRRKKLNLTQKYNSSNIKNTVDIFNVFVCGSDQVWNSKLNGMDNTYFFDFLDDDSVKIAYSASFGSTVTNTMQEDIKIELLKRFNYIGVRELDAQVYLAVNGINSVVTCDPTLFFDNVFWSKMAKKPHFISRKFIFVYLVAPSDSIVKRAITFSKIFGYDIFIAHSSYKNIKGARNIKTLSPDEFIWMIKNCEHVFTTSFHAVCFSIIFKKDLSISLDSNTINSNSRIETLLKILKLEYINNDNILEVSNYSKIENNLKEYVDDSLSFLRESITH